MKKPTNVTIFYPAGEKSEDCHTQKEALRRATDWNWYPNDFNTTKDCAVIRCTNIATGAIILEILHNQ